MTIRDIHRPLSQLRARERALAVAWGLARAVAVAVVLLALACWIDWQIDLRRETPRVLRVGLLVGQLVVGAGLLLAWVIWPLFRRRPDDELALFVEEKHPALSHRLISAVQLNRPRAQTAGMSPILISALTEEAVGVVRRIDFPALADHRRAKWAAGVGAGVVLAAAILFLIAPATITALLARQGLANRDIPRRVTLTNRTVAVQPSNEPVSLQFAVTGDGPCVGEVRVANVTGSVERLPVDEDPVDGILTVKVPPRANDFTFEAWVGDGRLKEPGAVRLTPRPVITHLAAALILPKYMGVKQDGRAYEQSLPRGEITGISGCSAWIFAQVQKPITRANLELLGTMEGTRNVVSRTLPMQLLPENRLAIEFALHENESAYRVVVEDENGFVNLDPPRREVRLVTEEPPLVTLLPEQFRPEGFSGSAEDFEVEGVPVPLGGGVRIGYTASHAYGLGKAVLTYRINEREWRRLPLSEISATAATGPFDPRRGCFEKSRPGDQVQFTAVPSPDATVYPGRLEGGGRFDFQTRGLPGLKIGDTVEFFVEVTALNPDHGVVGRSETRAKRVVTTVELVEWIDATLRQEDRIRRLADRQRGVFDSRSNP